MTRVCASKSGSMGAHAHIQYRQCLIGTRSILHFSLHTSNNTTVQLILSANSGQGIHGCEGRGLWEFGFWGPM